MTSKRNFTCDREQSLLYWVEGTAPWASGNDLHAVIGRSTLITHGSNYYIGRELLHFALDWSSVYQIVKAKLWVKSDDFGHIGSNANVPHPTIQRLAGSFIEGGGGENHWTYVSPGTDWPGPSVTGSTIDSGTISLSPNTWFWWDVTPFIEAWAPAGVRQRAGTPGNGSTNYGIRVVSADEANILKAWEFYSRRSPASVAPYIELEYTTNTPPGVPIITSPRTNGDGSAALVPSRNATTVPIIWEFNGAANKYAYQRQYQLYASAATDGSHGNPLSDKTFKAANGTSPRSGTDTITGAIARKAYRMRARTQTPGPTFTWGAWTSLADGFLETAFIGRVPSRPFFGNITTAPEIAGSIDSNDPADYVTGYEVEVLRPGVAGAAIPMWLIGKQAIGGVGVTRASVNYSGTQISPNDVLRWRHRIYGRDGIAGDWSAYMNQKFSAVTGPTAMSPTDRSTKLLATTGPLTIADANPFDQIDWSLRADGVVIFASGTLSVNNTTVTIDVTIPAGLVNFGANNLEWQAAIRHTNGSVLEPASPWYPIQIDTLPSTAFSLAEAITRSDGVLVVPTLNPLMQNPYIDADVASYGEAIGIKEFEIRVANAVPGAGALIRKRTSVSQVVENERVGEQVDALTATTGWTADSGAAVAAYTATAPTGYSTSTSLEVQATGASALQRGARKAYVADLSAYGSGATFLWQRRITSNTNLARWAVRFEMGSSTDYAEYSLAWGTDAINTWAEVVVAKGNPYITAGTVDWSNVTNRYIVVIPPGTNYTGSIEVRDLRLGITQNAKTTPTGALAYESSYDFRARYHDTATPKLSTTIAANSAAAATNIKMTSVTGVPALAVGDWLTIETAGLVESRKITTIGTAGAGGTGITVSEGFTYAHTSGDVTKVYFWGPWTGWYAGVKFSQPPAAGLSTPADAASVTDPTVSLVHTFSSAASKAQISHTYRVYLRGTDDQLIRSVTTADNGLTDVLPRFLLDDALTYAWEVDVVDSDSLVTTSVRRSFTTAFTPPAALTNLSVTEDTTASSLTLTWDASSDTYFDHYVVEWRDAGGNWLGVDGGPVALDDGLTPLTSPTFTFYGGRQGSDDFRVMAHNGAISNGESDPSLVTGGLDSIRPGAWAIAQENSDQFTFPFDPDDAQRTHLVTIEAFSPPGRGTPIHFNWGSDGVRLALTLTYNPAGDGDLVTLFEQLQNGSVPVWVKAAAGYQWDPLRGVVVSVVDTAQPNGNVKLSLTIDETDQ